jgi:excisionase family DNA binding protein
VYHSFKPLPEQGCGFFLAKFQEGGSNMVKLLTVDGLAKKWEIPVSWLYRKCREGKIPHFRIGKYIRFSEEEV